MTRAQRIAEFRRLLEQRVLLLDGAMGTMIQGYKPDGRPTGDSVSATGRPI